MLFYNSIFGLYQGEYQNATHYFQGVKSLTGDLIVNSQRLQSRQKIARGIHTRSLCREFFSL
jgi:hypothetical protein